MTGQDSPRWFRVIPVTEIQNDSRSWKPCATIGEDEGALATFAGFLVAFDRSVLGCGTANSNEPELPALPPIQHATRAGCLHELIGDTELLNEYWNEQAAVWRDDTSPRALVSVLTRPRTRAAGGGRSSVGRSPVPLAEPTIAWSRSPVCAIVSCLGDAAVAFLLGHEYGHMVQDELEFQRVPPHDRGGTECRLFVRGLVRCGERPW